MRPRCAYEGRTLMLARATERLRVVALGWGGIIALGLTGYTLQVRVQGEDHLLGRWQLDNHTTGIGLLVHFDIRPDGTYDYLTIMTNNGTCTFGLSYQGKFQVSRNTIDFTALSGGKLSGMKEYFGPRNWPAVQRAIARTPFVCKGGNFVTIRHRKPTNRAFLG